LQETKILSAIICDKDKEVSPKQIADDTVWYDIFAFSRPRQMLDKLGYPLSRLLQRRFAEGSKAAMFQAVRDP
jgi:uncharacterized protein (UPF0548 family)